MTTANATERPASPQGGLLARHPLVFYFLIAFAFSWLMFTPVITFYGVLDLAPQLVGYLVIVGLLGSVLSGFVMTAVTEGRAAWGTCCNTKRRQRGSKPS